jgi:hypothetical protein
MRNINLEKRLRGHKWAYTGSLAMKIHANRLGVPFHRNVGNINIAANRPLNIVPVITASKRWKLNDAPTEKHTMFVSKNGGKLNMFKAGGYIAPSMRHVQFIGNVPVMSLNSLLNKKRNMNNNRHILTTNEVKKLNSNINMLRRLIAKNKKRVSPKRNNNNSSNRVRNMKPRALKFNF